MTKLDKLIAKLLKTPCSLAYKDIIKVMFYFGFVEINAKGSHIKYKSEYFEKDLIIPIHNNDCKCFYKKMAANRISKIINITLK